MFNEDLYQKILEEFGKEETKKYCLMTSRMYHHMNETFSIEVLNEYQYECDWWYSKYEELNKIDIL